MESALGFMLLGCAVAVRKKRKPVRLLFWIEVLINACSGPMIMFAPQLTLGPLLGGGVRMSEEAAEVSRWFGCMVFAFGSVLLGRALYDGRAEILKPILEAFLVGDVCYTTLSAHWLWRTANWGPTAIFNLSFSAVLLLARAVAMFDINCVTKSDSIVYKSQRSE